MKKINLFNLLLIGAMLFALAACSQQFQQHSNAPSQSQETQMSDNNTETKKPENSQSATIKDYDSEYPSLYSNQSKSA
jgi:outer membrane lipopolysaccharide assembly protein LptE/RlpB